MLGSSSLASGDEKMKIPRCKKNQFLRLKKKNAKPLRELWCWCWACVRVVLSSQTHKASLSPPYQWHEGRDADASHSHAAVPSESQVDSDCNQCLARALLAAAEARQPFNSRKVERGGSQECFEWPVSCDRSPTKAGRRQAQALEH